MYKIGEFAKKVGLSIKTLRYYDEFGILKPNEVDRFTGYRYYTDDDIVKCEYVKLLKSLDYTLNEINQYKNSLDIKAITQKQNEIEEKIETLKFKYEELNKLKKKMSGNSIMPENIGKESELNEK